MQRSLANVLSVRSVLSNTEGEVNSLQAEMVSLYNPTEGEIKHTTIAETSHKQAEMKANASVALQRLQTAREALTVPKRSPTFSQ